MSEVTERIHVTRSRANPGGHGRPQGPRRGGAAVPRPQAAVVQGAAARRPEVPRADRDDQVRGAAHGLPGGGLPERRRVLGARHRDLHDPRRHLHPPLRLLQRQDRQADLERPARAAARRALGGEDGPAARGHHERRPRRPARLRRVRLRRRRSARSAGRRRSCKVEVLTPDFRGEEMPLAKVIAERPDVFNHNVEVVPRLYPVARRGSRWERSLRVLRNAKEMGGDEVTTKSGLMVGLGETHEEMVEAFGALREHGVQVLTVGQYLRPTERHLPVVRYWHPDEFTALEARGLRAGLRPHRRRAARALELPRRPARAAVPAGQRPARRRRRLAPALRVPAQGQHPDGSLPRRHGDADRAQRDRVLLLAEGRAVVRGPEQPGLLRQPGPLRDDPVRDHAPGPAVRAGDERRVHVLEGVRRPATTCRRPT